MQTPTAMHAHRIPITPVESSQIHGIGFHHESGTLSVQFKGKGGTPGSIYRYQNVTPAQFAEFQKAESVGKHFGKHFKANPAHPFIKVA